MDFSNLEQVRAQLATLKRNEEPFAEELGQNLFERFGFNGFEIELLTGGLFSEPSIKLVNPLKYHNLSVLIYEKIKGQEHQVFPCTDERFKQYDWCKYFHFIDSTGKDKASYMGTCIPMDEVCQLVRAVYKTSRLKLFY